MSTKRHGGDDHAALAGALPFYAANALGAAERREVETHLAECETCREALEEIRALAELGDAIPTERATEHVSAGLLVEYAESPDSLEPETRAFVEARLAACATCREAYEHLLEADAALRAAPEPQIDTPREIQVARPGLWERLAATVLRPAPALAYLMIVVIGLPLVWMLQSPGDPVSAVSVIAVGGDRGMRDGATQAPPLEVSLPAGGAAVLLELETDLLAGDLETLRFSVELTAGDRSVWEEERSGNAFVVRDGRAVLPLVLQPHRLQTGRDHRVTIRAVAPGDPLDGQALFSRSLRFLEN